MKNVVFTCTSCQRVRLGQFASPGRVGLVCEGGCAPRACRCLCQDEHSDGLIVRAGMDLRAGGTRDHFDRLIIK